MKNYLNGLNPWFRDHPRPMAGWNLLPWWNHAAFRFTFFGLRQSGLQWIACWSHHVGHWHSRISIKTLYHVWPLHPCIISISISIQMEVHYTTLSLIRGCNSMNREIRTLVCIRGSQNHVVAWPWNDGKSITKPFMMVFEAYIFISPWLLLNHLIVIYIARILLYLVLGQTYAWRAWIIPPDCVSRWSICSWWTHKTV